MRPGWAILAEDVAHHILWGEETQALRLVEQGHDEPGCRRERGDEGSGSADDFEAGSAAF